MLKETVNRKRREPSYRPIVLIENASLEQVYAVRLRHFELVGIDYQEVPARKYPSSDLAAHLFGYVSEVNEAQLARQRLQRHRAGRAWSARRGSSSPTTGC